MITLLSVHLINPGTNRVMCTKMRKNCNYTADPDLITCSKCKHLYALNVQWHVAKVKKFGGTDDV